MQSNVSSERGAILIQVALALVVLIGFSMFAFDYGVMWSGRGQAQNAADAGALAGATALAFDNFNDRTDTGPAKVAAHEFAVQNYVWGQAPAHDITTDVTFPTSPAVCADTSCIRVNVYRNDNHQNPLPAIFGLAVGLTSQGVNAMAIARAATANASDCMKPWAIPDKWQDNYDVTAPIDTIWTADDTFETNYDSGNLKGQPLPNPDVYTPPTNGSPGTGFTVQNDLGLQLTLKAGSPSDAIAPGVFYPVDLPRADGAPDTGGARYSDNIANCNGIPINIGDPLTTENGNMIGPTSQGVQALIAQDPDATWDSTTKKVVGGCVQAGTCAQSPRVVAIPIFDTGAYYAGKLQGKTVLNIVNILGFFIDQMQGNDVVGYLTQAPGLVTGTAPFDPNSSFIKTVLLVR
ncbi:MAG: pilus assembly protein TadG-related protein [Deltaproteobacteria bacterium]